MSQSARDLLVHGIAAAKAKDLREAHFYLEWVLQTDADRRQQIDAWWWIHLSWFFCRSGSRIISIKAVATRA